MRAARRADVLERHVLDGSGPVLARGVSVGALRSGRSAAICGQAPSDHPDVAAFLVRLGIDALSLNPDSVLKTTLAVLDIERAESPR